MESVFTHIYILRRCDNALYLCFLYSSVATLCHLLQSVEAELTEIGSEAALPRLKFLKTKYSPSSYNNALNVNKWLTESPPRCVGYDKTCFVYMVAVHAMELCLCVTSRTGFTWCVSYVAAGVSVVTRLPWLDIS